MPFFARRHAVAGFLCAFLAATPSLALAQKKSASVEAKQREAREHYQKGITHYNLGEFAQSIEEFKQAYAISQAHGLLFNIAQAYRLTQDHKQALYFYRTYLRLVPEAPNRADVEARMVEIEKLLAEQERLKNDQPVGVIAPADVSSAAPPVGASLTATSPARSDVEARISELERQRAAQERVRTAEPQTIAPSSTPAEPTYTPRADAAVERPLAPSRVGKGSVSTFVRSDIDVEGRGLALALGVSRTFSEHFQVVAAGVIGAVPGAELGATYTMGWGRLRPLFFGVVPLFVKSGIIMGVRAGGGAELQLSQRLGVFALLGAAYFPSVPQGFDKMVLLSTLGFAARL